MAEDPGDGAGKRGGKPVGKALFSLETRPEASPDHGARAERLCPRCLRVFPVATERCPEDGHALLVIRRNDSDPIGRVIDGRLTLLGVLGTGGSGTGSPG